MDDYAELIFDGVALGKFPKVTNVYGKDAKTEDILKAWFFVYEDEEEEGYDIVDESGVDELGEMTAQDGRLGFVMGSDPWMHG